MKKRFSMNLQLFAEPAGGTAGTEGQQTPPSSGQQAQTGQTSPQIDYAKI